MASMQTVRFKAGETILSEGEEGDTAFLIVSGSVDVSIGTNEKAGTIGTLSAGEVFGELCLIEPGPRSATITAVTHVISDEEAERIFADQGGVRKVRSYLRYVRDPSLRCL